MRHFEGSAPAGLPKGGFVTIGNFDGIHRGHALILRRLVEEARREELPSLVLTFDPHPVKVLRPEIAPALITTREQRMELLETFGLDALWEMRFTREIAQEEPEDFIRQILVQSLAARRLLLGAGFRFGYRKRGDMGLLTAEGGRWGFSVEAAAPVDYDGAPISSSRIRSCIGAGDMGPAEAMLGRPFELIGTVEEGRRRGTGIGFPTVNLLPENELSPADGIYAAEVRVPGDSPWLPTAASIGTNPTFGGTQRTFEGFILDFDRALYGMRIRMRLRKKLRDQEAFPSREALGAAIALDVEAVRAFFGALPGKE
jgi:riboflavin kinase/FMN adenylyltransferase